MMPESLLLPYVSVRLVNKVSDINARGLLRNTRIPRYFFIMLFFRKKMTSS